MRLGTFLLIGCVLAASGGIAQERLSAHRALDWERVMPMAWIVAPASREAQVPEPPVASSGPMVVQLSGDGTLQVQDGRKRTVLKTGLPGRPLQAWRDGGVGLPSAAGEWGFPADTPLSQGLGALQWCSADFRPFLRGLLWVLEDGEAYLSIVHPATARVIHVPLPPGRDMKLLFLPDRLEVLAGEVDRGAPRRWSLPWMGFLPRLSELCPEPNPAKPGSALLPFPKN